MRIALLSVALAASIVAAPLSAQNVTSCGSGQLCLRIDSGSAAVPLTTVTGSAAVAINPSTGDVTVRSRDGVVQQCTQASTDPAITIGANPTALNSGENTTISWTTVNVPTTGTPCTPSGGPSNWTSLGPLPSSGNRTVSVTGSPGAVITYTLTCTGTNGSQVSNSTQVSINQSGADCTGQNAPPAGYDVQQQPLIGTFQSPDGQFPPSANGVRIQLASATARAYSFTARIRPGTSGAAGVTTDEWFGVGGPSTFGAGTITISRCPADFGNNLAAAQCRSGPAGANSISYTMVGGFGCQMIPGQAYFFNMTSGNCSSPGCSSLGFCSAFPCSPLTLWAGTLQEPKRMQQPEKTDAD